MQSTETRIAALEAMYPAPPESVVKSDKETLVAEVVRALVSIGDCVDLTEETYIDHAQAMAKQIRCEMPELHQRIERIWPEAILTLCRVTTTF